MISSMEPLILLLGGFAVLLAVISQLLTGFGFAMVLVPLLLLMIDPADAVVTAAMLGTLLTSLQTVKDRSHVDRRMTSALLAWSLAGLPLGLLAMTLLSAEALKWAVVGVVLLALLIVMRGTVLKNTPVSSAIA